MPRHINIAAVQMNAALSPKAERLGRAANLIEQAAADGAQLIVLPELFNTGYEYHEKNYSLPETIDGDTATWMRAQAAKHGVHLAGSFLLLDGREVFNALLLVAPDGRQWRYDKNYPWAFERAYYRDGTEKMIANTDLGKIGMMICWDYAHPEMWQRYAGQVDMVIISSSPPRMTQFEVILPNNHRVDSRALGPVINRAHSGEPFGADMDAQLGWLGVPGVNTSGGGTLRTEIPRPRLTAAAFLSFRPDLWRFVSGAADALLTTDYYQQTKVVGADGTVLKRFQGDEGYVTALVELADETPGAPTATQPEIPFTNAIYFFMDVFVPAITERLYREGMRRQWGQRMAPFQRSIRWSIVLGLGALGLVAALVRGLGHMAGGRERPT